MSIHVVLGLTAIALIAVLFYVPNSFTQKLKDTFNIRKKRFKNATTPPIQRELEMVAGPLRVIEESHVQVQDLRGMLVHENNVLLQRQDELRQAESQYFEAVDDKTDTGVDELVLIYGEKEQDVAVQQGVVDGIQAAVAAACQGVDQARKELRRVQATIKSDEAMAKATDALKAAAQVLEAARSITSDGGALKEVSGEVVRDFEAAKARVNAYKGTPVDRELNSIDDQQHVDELRKRLEAKRPAKQTPAKS